MPAVRLSEASKPLIGRVKNVWKVSERLLIISNALPAGMAMSVLFTARPRRPMI